MRLSKCDIIHETFEFYNTDPAKRAACASNICSYLTQSGKMCALGRYLIDPSKMKCGSIVKSTYDIAELDLLLREEYRGHSIPFWQSIQCLHDQSQYWDKGGATIYGRIYYGNLLNIWSRG